MKTIDDCTREDLGRLVEAAINLLRMSMFYCWQEVGEADEDPYRMDAINEMRDALIQCGLDAPTYEEYSSDLVEVLKQRPKTHPHL